jgi:hypothetical protein
MSTGELTEVWSFIVRLSRNDAGERRACRRDGTGIRAAMTSSTTHHNPATRGEAEMKKTSIALAALVAMVSVAGTTVAFAELESQTLRLERKVKAKDDVRSGMAVFRKCSVHSKKC